MCRRRETGRCTQYCPTVKRVEERQDSSPRYLPTMGEGEALCAEYREAYIGRYTSWCIPRVYHRYYPFHCWARKGEERPILASQKGKKREEKGPF